MTAPCIVDLLNLLKDSSAGEGFYQHFAEDSRSASIILKWFESAATTLRARGTFLPLLEVITFPFCLLACLPLTAFDRAFNSSSTSFPSINYPNRSAANSTQSSMSSPKIGRNTMVRLRFQSYRARACVYNARYAWLSIGHVHALASALVKKSGDQPVAVEKALKKRRAIDQGIQASLCRIVTIPHSDQLVCQVILERRGSLSPFSSLSFLSSPYTPFHFHLYPLHRTSYCLYCRIVN
jgi:hypothetical protein